MKMSVVYFCGEMYGKINVQGILGRHNFDG
jgi:hypothetical protein